jgi:hypothetical protein
LNTVLGIYACITHRISSQSETAEGAEIYIGRFAVIADPQVAHVFGLRL